MARLIPLLILANNALATSSSNDIKFTIYNETATTTIGPVTNGTKLDDCFAFFNSTTCFYSVPGTTTSLKLYYNLEGDHTTVSISKKIIGEL